MRFKAKNFKLEYNIWCTKQEKIKKIIWPKLFNMADFNNGNY